jgi:molybdopterin converting factor small subunit
MKVAVNDQMAALTMPLEDGDRVLFFPPVSGG